ncbi:MAG TPA: signal peptidase I [Patescibacteria group bacterium]|nr:signal peptidase I [Patescibacteria group bacterium]
MSQTAVSEKSEKPAAGADTQGTRHSIFLEYAESLLVTVILALYFTSFILQAYRIPTPSMEPTLLVGDHLLVNKFIFGGSGAWYDRVLPYRPIHRGDIIVFKFPFADHTNYVKRVIGLPGDRLKIVDQFVYINGKLLTEPYAYRPEGWSEPYGDNFPPGPGGYLPAGMVEQEWRKQIFQFVHNGELTVPPHKYFAMGDNRERSWDSRYWGFVDEDAIMGRPMFIYWSINSAADEAPDQSLSSGLTSLMDVLLHFPSRTRWSRMFHLVH